MELFLVPGDRRTAGSRTSFGRRFPAERLAAALLPDFADSVCSSC
jgi:hypothetical protein